MVNEGKSEETSTTHLVATSPLTKFQRIIFAHDLTLIRPAHEWQKLTRTLGAAKVDLNPHQVDAALFAFRSPLSRGAILADEVGLGKTIEAGLIVGQLWAEGKRHILIFVPASLRQQWQDELREKFEIPSLVMDGRRYQALKREGPLNPFADHQVYIVSTQLAYRLRDEIAAASPWHLMVVDEAHRLRNVYKSDSKIARALRELISPHPKVLLTATPLHNSLLELYGLVSFIDDKLLGTDFSFRLRFMADIRGLVVREQDELASRLQQVCIRTLRRQVREYVSFTNRVAMLEDFTPTDLELDLYEKVSAYLQRPVLAAIEHSQRALMVLVYRKLLASSSFAIARTLQSLSENLERKLAGMAVKPLEDLLTDVDGIHEEIEELAEPGDSGDVAVAPELPQEEFRPEQVEAELQELREYKALAESIQRNSKGEALLIALRKVFAFNGERGWPEKVVIFTESRRTQQYLYRLLSQHGYDGEITLFSGTNEGELGRRALALWESEHPPEARPALPSREALLREALVYEFKRKNKILIATEAGGEGLNLQFCNVVINYDLPWNPQRIEQRIGRCHRYGQKHDVVVLNFLNRKNAADQRVYELLAAKFRLFEGVFGSSDEILGALGSGVDFERRVLSIYQTCRTEAEIQKAFDSLQEELAEEIATRMAEAREALLTHFDDDVRTKLRTMDTQIRDALSWVDIRLDRLLTSYFGNACTRRDGPPVIFEIKELPSELALNLPGDVRPGTFHLGVTPAEADSRLPPRLHLGHPLVAGIVRDLKSHPLALHRIRLLYTEGRHRITRIEPLLGQGGIWLVYRFRFEGLEAEERLGHVLLVRKDQGLAVLEEDLSPSLLTLTAVEYGTPVPLEPSLEKEPEVQGLLRKIEAGWTDEVRERNEAYFDRETEKIETYSEEALMRMHAELDKTDQALKEARRRRGRAGSFEERQAIRREIHRLEQEFSRQADRIAQEKKRLFEEKERIMRDLEKRLHLKVDRSLVTACEWRLE